MATVTYKAQPAIEKTKGAIPLAGTSHIYTVAKVLWPEAVSEFIKSQFIGTVLHLCSGASPLGDFRVDADSTHNPDLVADAAHTALPEGFFDTVLCDPPYNGKMQWNHDLLTEIGRLATKRIIFQHWFIPADKDGLWKKWHKFQLTGCYVWQPRTYFGRAQIISVFDAV